MQSVGFVPQIIDIISAVIIYFAAFVLFFSQLMSKLAKRKEASGTQTEKGGGGQ